MNDRDRSVTYLLSRWSEGDRQAAGDLLPRVYVELRSIAARLFRDERRDHTWSPTALVHEVYLRLEEGGAPRWESRRHFFAVAACMMRHALVDHGRHHARRKRGGGRRRVSLEAVGELPLPDPEHLVALNDALETLERRDPRKAAVVELRFFGGLTIDETATTLGVAAKTVVREWRRAKAWLYRELTPTVRQGLAAGPPAER